MPVFMHLSNDKTFLQTFCKAATQKEMRNSPINLSYHGYDEDPRELWEVVEVVASAKQLVDEGFYGAVAYSLRSPSSSLVFDMSVFVPSICASGQPCYKDFDFLRSIKAFLADEEMDSTWKVQVGDPEEAARLVKLMYLGFLDKTIRGEETLSFFRFITRFGMEANADVIAAAKAQYEKKVFWEDGMLNDNRSSEAIAAYETEYIQNTVRDILATMNIG